MNTTNDRRAHDRARALMARHFDAATGPAEEAELRAHLDACRACRDHYERHMLFAALDPRAPSLRERMARGIGVARPSPASTRAPRAALGLLVVTAAVAGAFVLMVKRAPNGDDGGFTGRGAPTESVGDDAPPALLLYRAAPSATPQVELVTDVIAPDDELLVALRGVAAHETTTALLVFGVDEHGHVFWYAPLWPVGAPPPEATRVDDLVARGPDVLEWPHAVRHGLDGARLAVFAVLVDDVATTAEVERRLAGPLARASAASLGAGDVRDALAARAVVKKSLRVHDDDRRASALPPPTTEPR